jgi:hypothetical protein
MLAGDLQEMGEIMGPFAAGPQGGERVAAEPRGGDNRGRAVRS